MRAAQDPSHLQQALTNARVNVRGDDTLNLGALARVRVFFVSIAVIRRDAPGVARAEEGWSRMAGSEPESTFCHRRWLSA